MHRLLLSVAVLLSLTACHERRGPEPETSKLTEKMFTSSQTEVETTVEERSAPATEKQAVEASSEDTVLIDVPMLEEELPTIPLPVEESVSKPAAQFTERNKSGGTITDGLTMKEIRISQSPERTRVVFDSYSGAAEKASVSGKYTFKYDAKAHRIVLTVNGYRHFTALGKSKIRTFSANSIIKKIYLVPYKDDSGFQCNIDLRKGAKVNAFDLKEPGRIVIDIMPN